MVRHSECLLGDGVLFLSIASMAMSKMHEGICAMNLQKAEDAF